MELSDDDRRTLKNLYENPKFVGSYSTPTFFLKSLKKKYGHRNIPLIEKLTFKKVSDFLGSLNSYSQYKPARRRFKRNKVIASGVNSQWQSDIIDMTPKYKKVNKGYRFILVAIDVVSKKVYAEALKTKSAQEVKEAFKKIFQEAKESDTLPYKVQTDKGGEFINKVVRALAKEYGVKFFTAEDDDTKAQIAERFNRTLKKKLFKYMSDHKGVWYKPLPDFVNNYNRTVHTTTGMEPDRLNEKNEWKALSRMYDVKGTPAFVGIERSSRLRFKTGDYVRISVANKTFRRGFRSSWSEEVFRIRKIYPGVNGSSEPTALLEDLSETPIKGQFYFKQLSFVSKSEPAFEIGPVISRDYKRRTVTVKRKGYPDKKAFTKVFSMREYKEAMKGGNS